ncbi:hypothetical protein RN001_005552 [Aquatica leii]|uniref:Uncharacterized protein n=1 Tax=Aquatica leii TaxID=1421715 RepID=A0AAN7PCV1_9COLE|nr:hypothetical protein RN001_005552 [Aquatica leii]
MTPDVYWSLIQLNSIGWQYEEVGSDEISEYSDSDNDSLADEVLAIANDFEPDTDEDLWLDEYIDDRSEGSSSFNEDRCLFYHGKADRDLCVFCKIQQNVSYGRQVQKKMNVRTKSLKIMLSFYSQVEGHDPINKTNTILKKVISNQLACSYSFLGSRYKKTFKQLLICKLIIVQNSANQTDRQISDYIKVWLKHAPQRAKADILKRKKFVETENSNKLPCIYCKRLVKASYLRRHYKVCVVKPINKSNQKIQHQAQSQTLLACAADTENTAAAIQLKNEVFLRIRADDIALIAKKDDLIRRYGENYLKRHKRAQIVVPCSNKIRECAKLLKETRRRKNNNKLTFFDIISTCYYDIIVASAKTISRYDDTLKEYLAPSLAIHLGTTLKQISDLCSHLILKNIVSKHFRKHIQQKIPPKK